MSFSIERPGPDSLIRCLEMFCVQTFKILILGKNDITSFMF
jgi:hypothetical protein